jgi:RNA polymerase sigma-70 factor (ECF subfamily)
VSAQDELLGKSPEALLVTLARQGHRDAFAELVRRREPWIRALMLRCCNDYALALRLASRFGPWLKRLAINEWLQHVRKSDPLEHADDVEVEAPESAAAGVAMDLDEALSTLKEHVRLCIVLSYHEGMTHDEIANFTGIALGTVKSHIRRGTQRLQELLAAYKGAPSEENST